METKFTVGDVFEHLNGSRYLITEVQSDRYITSTQLYTGTYMWLGLQNEHEATLVAGPSVVDQILEKYSP